MRGVSITGFEQTEAGLLFTDVPHADVQKVLNEAQLEEFARAGAPATEAVELPEGPLHQFPHNMEPYLRKLGLPTKLDNGIVTLRCNHAVCFSFDCATIFAVDSPVPISGASNPETTCIIIQHHNHIQRTATTISKAYRQNQLLTPRPKQTSKPGPETPPRNFPKGFTPGNC